jgi:hypothetical protein
MKKLALIFALAAFTFSGIAQKPLATFFSSGGEEFYVIMDGKKNNSEPQSRVENIPLANDWAKVKIMFKNEEILPIEKTIQGKDADGNISSVTWEISQNNKGKWVVKPTAWSKIEGGSTVKSNIVEEPIEEIQPSEETTTTTQTTTTTYSDEPANESAASTGVNSVTMSVNMNDGGENANMNINMSTPGETVTQTQSHSQTTYTTITTTTTTSGNNNAILYEEPSPMPGYEGRVGCNQPLTEERFESVKKSISSKNYEDSKLTVAKQVANSNCLFADQVKQIMRLFGFESTRLEFAKEAYSHTYDIDNYYLLNDAFDFESSISELNEFISK